MEVYLLPSKVSQEIHVTNHNFRMASKKFSWGEDTDDASLRRTKAIFTTCKLRPMLVPSPVNLICIVSSSWRHIASKRTNKLDLRLC